MDHENTTSKTLKAARDFTRRSLLKGAALGGGAVAVAGAAGQIGFPFVGTAKAQGTTWKIQTSWPSGVGLNIFNVRAGLLHSYAALR